MKKLDISDDCFKLNSIKHGCPTVADDMILTSLTKNGLQRLIDVCYENSITNKYSYNPLKYFSLN